VTENNASSDASPSPSGDVMHRLPAAALGSPADEVSLLELFNLLLKRRRIVFGLPVVAALVVAVFSFVVPSTYTAMTTFVPQARTPGRFPSGVAGLAGQLGISFGVEATESPRFYANLVKSRELLERILLSEYQDPRETRSSPDSTTLLRLLNVKGRDAADSLHHGVKALNNLVSARVDNQTNVVRLSVDARYPTLAAAVANRFVAYLNDFNARTRQSQARERRKFVEQRLADGELELRTAEESLRTFYERNRSWQQSPQLVFDEGRLRRQVDVRQEVYLTLRREYETARIEEVNDTPVITVIDRAAPPQERSRPRRMLLVVVALVLGGIVGVFWAAGGEYFDRARRANDRDYQQFSTLLEEVGQQAGQTLRVLHRKTKSGETA
jgi:tyrosine-protein kinase Etk/Wzc